MACVISSAFGVQNHRLRTPENQGYGGNQKLGYRYAIETVSTSSRSSMVTASTRRKNCPLCSRRSSR